MVAMGVIEFVSKEINENLGNRPQSQNINVKKT